MCCERWLYDQLRSTPCAAHSKRSKSSASSRRVGSWSNSGGSHEASRGGGNCRTITAPSAGRWKLGARQTLQQEAGQPAPALRRPAGLQGNAGTKGGREGGRPWPVSDLHLPLRDHSIHLVSHRAAFRGSKQPPPPRAALPSQPRPLRGQLPTLRASGARRPPRFRRALMASRVSVQGDGRDLSELSRSPGRPLPLAGSSRRGRSSGALAPAPGEHPGAGPRVRSRSGACGFLSLDGARLNFLGSGFTGNPLSHPRL